MLTQFRSREPIVLRRDCSAIQIPDGNRMTLPSGSKVFLNQELGGSFTVSTDSGYFVRIDGADADAMGIERSATDQKSGAELLPNGVLDDAAVYAQLRTCYDPEIPVNIVELGLIYGCKIVDNSEGAAPKGKRVEVEMTLTAPGCGMGQVLQDDVVRKVGALPGVAETHVSLVFDPPWDSSMMSEAARLQLGMM